MTVYLLERIQFWNIFTLLFPLALLFSLIYLIIFIRSKEKFSKDQLIIILYFVFSYFVFFIPAHKIFYVEHLNSFLNEDSRRTDYFNWDKYSWFLYRYGMQKEALEANTNAKNAIDEMQKIHEDNKAEEYLTILKKHEQQILENNWTEYPDGKR